MTRSIKIHGQSNNCTKPDSKRRSTVECPLQATSSGGSSISQTATKTSTGKGCQPMTLPNFFQKVHKNKKNWAYGRRGVCPCATLNPPMLWVQVLSIPHEISWWLKFSVASRCVWWPVVYLLPCINAYMDYVRYKYLLNALRERRYVRSCIHTTII